MIISEEFISELKARNDIEEIISSYVDLNRKGKNLMGLCPFHAERTPSFCVYPSNASFYCFGCGAGGDVITFLRLIEHYDYIETVKYLADRCGMNFEIDNQSDEIHRQKMLIYEMNREAAKFYYKSLFSPEGKVALNYLSERKLSSSTITHFGLGYSPKSGYSLVDYLKNKGYNIKDIVMSNLAFSARNSGARDRFRGRLMFPIIDVRGNVIAFGARTLKNEVPKYINTSDTPVFKKSNNLFSLNFAKNSNEKSFILTEGYMDVISLYQAGFPNAVAGLGTALTEGQVKLLSRYTNEVIICYDSDEPGQKAAERAISLLKENGVNIKVMTIPKGKDPDEYIKSQGENGKIKFKNLVENSKSDIEYKLLKVKSLYDEGSSADKIKYLTESARILSSCRSPIEREVFAHKLSSEAGISKSALDIQIEKFSKQKNKNYHKKEFKNLKSLTSGINDKINPDKHSNLRAAVAEEMLISYVINNPDKLEEILKKINSDCIITKFNQRVFKCVEKIVSEGKEPNLTTLSGCDFSMEEIGRITKMICSYNPSIITSESAEEYIKTILEENQKNKVKNVDNISEVEVKDYIKSLKNIKK